MLGFFSSADFMPHGHCFLWRPDLLILNVVADSVIAFSYYSIPFALIYFVVKRPDVLFRRVAVLFGVFILACGTTHIMAIVVLWNPIYWVDGLIKAVTAVASLATAILVWRIMPQALTVPSMGQLQGAVTELGNEVANRRRAEAEVRSLNSALEQRVQARTLDLERSNAELQSVVQAREVLLKEVHHRVKNNLQVVSALLAMQSEAAPEELKGYFQDSAARIEAMGRVHDQLYRTPDIASLDLGDYLANLAGVVSRIYERSDVSASFALPPDKVRIVFEMANPLVLMLNEALSNVFRHAFPAGRGGTIIITLNVVDGRPVVTITDDGIGMAPRRDTSPRASMGINLIRMLAQQIGAEITYGGVNGTTFSVALPRSVVVAV
jgi:two-component sensor histidine kinase